MTQTVSEPHTGRQTPRTQKTSFSPLLITFLMKKSGREMQVRCRGCREIAVPTDPLPGQFGGLIELDGQPIPVMDATASFSTEETPASAGSCIVVIDREYESQRVRIGVIVGDIDEVMQLAAGVGLVSAGAKISANMDMVVKMFDTANPQELLVEHHREFQLLAAAKSHTGAVFVSA